MKRLIPVLIVVSAAGLACSDDDASPVCDARDDLQTSVEELRDVNVVDDGLDALRDSVDDVSDDLATFRAEAGAELQPEIDAVSAALDDVRAAVGSGGSAADVAQSIAGSLGELTTSWNELADAAQSACD